MKNKKKLRFSLAAGVVLALGIGLGSWVVSDRAVDEEIAQSLEELAVFEGTYNEKQIILPNTNKAQAQKIAEEIGARVRITEDGNFAALYLPEDVNIKDIYENEEYKEYVGDMMPDYYGTLSGSSDPNAAYSEVTSCINLGDTWNTTKGSGTKIAVIDTGVDTDNPYIASKISDRSFNASEGKVVADYDLSVIEENGAFIGGHGTQVASIIAADYDANTQTGGIAPEAELIVIKLNPDEEGKIEVSDAVFGLAYAIECDADVVNMSFCFETPGNPFEKYTQLAVDSDVICVASAGDKSTSVQVWPAADENVIGVGTVEKVGSDYGSLQTGVTTTFNPEMKEQEGQYTLTPESNFGENVNIVAYEKANTLLVDKDGAKVVGTLSGTSASSAMTSASIALYLSQNAHQELKDIKEILSASSVDMGVEGVDWYYGYGLLDVHALVVEEKGTITFDYLTDEIESETHVFVRGHKLQEVPEPERMYLVFDGWYSDIHCMEEYDNFTKTLYEDVSVYASWVNEDDTQPYTYIVKADGTAEITGYTGKRRYLTVPEIIDGYTVTSIGENAFNSNHRMKKIILPETLQSIGKKAFYNCVAVSMIEIPASVYSISESAFESCSRLGEVVFAPQGSLQILGENAFAHCGSLRRIDLPENLQNVSGTTFYKDSGLTQIGVETGNPYLSTDGTGLYTKGESKTLIYVLTGRSGSYVVENDTKQIGESAFVGSALTEIELPEQLSDIGKYAFSESRIQSINIPSGVTIIPEYCFYKCNNLWSIEIGSGTTFIDKYAFSNCRSLTTVTIPENNLKIIEKQAFEYCESLSDISFIEAGITSIGYGAFYYCESIKEVYIPNSLTSLQEMAFAGCTGLENVVFEDGIKMSELSKWTFNQCLSLKSITLPEGLKSIGDTCFAASGLESIYIPSTVNNIGYGAFANCGNLSTIETAQDNITYKSINNVLYTVNEEGVTFELHTYPTGLTDPAFVIPDEVTSIAKYAFFAVPKLTDVTFGANVQTVGYGAFQNCYGLAGIHFNEALTEIGAYAFRGCKSLPEITFTSNITSVGDYAFESCTALAVVNLNEGLEELKTGIFSNCIRLNNVHFPSTMHTIGNECFSGCSGMDNLTITKGIITIGRYAFSGCRNVKQIVFEENGKLARLNNYSLAEMGLTSIRIPASITSMGQEVFSGCSNLTSVTFESGSGLMALAAWTFEGTPLKQIIFEEGSALTHIEARAFERLTTLETVDIQNCQNLEIINNYAFEYCRGLKELIIPEGVKEIGRYAFYGCKSLTELVMPSTIDFIGRYAFAGIPEIVIYFNSPVMPQNLQDYWDYEIKAYYLGTGEVVTSGDWQYTKLSNGTVALTAYTGQETEVVIDTIDGYVISAMGGNVLTDSSTIERLTLADSVVTISARAFDGAKALKSINIPASISFIGEAAFRGTGLESIVFEDGSQLSNIEPYTFDNTKNLKEITIPDTVKVIKTYAFNQSGLQSVNFGDASQLVEIGKFAFAETAIVQLELPDALKKIDYHAFEGITDLESVTFGTGELDLYGYAFFATGLKEVELPYNIRYVGEYCFAYCDLLESVQVSEDNLYYASIDGVLFNKSATKLIMCPAGKTGSFTIPDSAEVMVSGAFEGSSLSDITIGNGSRLSTIGYKAFYDCKNITYIHIPATVGSIDFYAFAYCTALETVDIADGSCMSGIYEGAFYGCESLMAFELPSDVSEIGEYAFYGCEAMTEFVIPEDSALNGVYEHAFEYTGITDFDIPNQVEYIGEYALANTRLTEVSIPVNVKEIGDGCFAGSNSIESMTFGSPEILEISRLPQMFEKTPTGLKNVALLEGTVVPENAFSGCTGLEKATVPETVLTVENSAFKGCTVLKEVIGLTNVKEIGDSAFHTCQSLVSVPEMEQIEYFGEHSFYQCLALKEVHLTNAVFIADCAFFRCEGLETIELSDKLEYLGGNAFRDDWKISTLIIPDQQKTGLIIKSGCFRNCGVTTLRVGKGITELGTYAFADCWKLTDVILTDVEKVGDWAFKGCAIKSLDLGDDIKNIGSEAFYDSSLDAIYLPDGTLTVGDRAFRNYQRHTSAVYIPETVTKLGERAFPAAEIFFEGDVLPENASSKWNIESEEHVKEYGARVYFGCGKHYEKDGLHYTKSEDKGIALLTYGGTETNLDIQLIEDAQVWLVNVSCFSGNSTLQNVRFGTTVEEVHTAAFSNCSSLSSVEFAEGVKIIGNSAFASCGALESVKIGDMLEQLGGGSFTNCSMLKSMDLSNTSITAIEESTFSGCTNLTSIVMPDSVTELNNQAFYQCTALAEVRLSEGLLSIGDKTFLGCTALTEMTLPSSMDTIGEHAFYNCTALANMTLNKGLTNIGAYAFSYSGITELILPDSVQTINPYTFNHCTKLSNVALGQVISIGNYAFSYCSSLKEIELPDTLESLGSYVFAYTLFEAIAVPDGIVQYGSYPFGSESQGKNTKWIFFESTNIPETITNGWDASIKGYSVGCIDQGIDEANQLKYVVTNEEVEILSCGDGIENLTIDTVNGYPVTKIADKAFEGKNTLKTVYIGDSVKSVGNSAFASCGKLTTVYMSDSIVSMGTNIFDKCMVLSEVNWPAGVTSVPAETFFCCYELEEIELPDTVKNIEKSAFSWAGITNIKFPEGLETIGDQAFYKCEWENLIVPESVTSIGAGAFMSNTRLKTVQLPSGLIDVSDSLFKDCTLLKEVVLPENVQSIGDYAFYRCPLTKIDLPGSVTTIGSYTFANSAITELLLPDGVTTIGSYAFNGCPITEIVIPDSVSDLDNYAFAQCTKLNKITLSEQLTEISDGLFSGCSQLTDVMIPISVETIGGGAFTNCKKLTSMELPNSVESIGSSAFSGCTGLKAFKMGDSVKTIGSSAFKNCTGLSEIELSDAAESIGSNAFYGCTGFTSLEIPEAIRSIGSSAFQNCTALQSIDLPQDLASIESTTFSGCTNLESVTGAEALKYIAKDAFTGCTKVMETDGDLLYVNDWAIGYTKNADGKYAIREGTKVIANALFSGDTSLTEITIPEGVKIINMSLFANCSNLTTVNGMSGVEVIEDTAFSGCANLQLKELPDGIKELGTKVFNGCKAITELVIPNGLEKMKEDALYGLEHMQSLTIPFIGSSRNATKTIDYLFNGRPTKLERVILTGDMTNLAASTFAGCTSIREIKMTGNIPNIGNYVFEECANLEYVEMPSGLKTIGARAFSKCTSLEKVVIPEGVETIGGSLCYECTSLKEVVLPESLVSIGSVQQMFYNCSKLERLTLPFVGDSRNSMRPLYVYFATSPADAQSRKTQANIKYIEIVGDIKKLPTNAFAYCYGLETLILPDTIDTLPSKFLLDTQVKDIRWPKDLKTIKSDALTNVPLENLVLPEGVVTIENSAIGGSSKRYVVIPSTVVDATGNTRFNISATEKISILSTNVSIGSCSAKILQLPYIGKSYDTPGTLMTASSILESVIIMDTCEMVSKDAFKGITGITIYCCEDALSTPWPEGWNNGNTVYYADKWRSIDFLVEGKMVGTCVQPLGDAIRMPAKSLRTKAEDNNYTYTFLGWDVTGDGTVDRLLSTTKREIITANAVFNQVAKNAQVNVETEAPVSNGDGTLRINAVSDGTDTEKLVASIQAENVQTMAGNEVAITTDLGVVSFDSSATETISETEGTVDLSIEKVESSMVSFANAQDALYDLSLTSGGEDVSFAADGENGTATITLPYQKDSVRDTVVYYVNESGVETEVPSVYNAEEQTITFTTNHFSLYRVSSKESDGSVMVAFESDGGTDVESMIGMPGEVVTLPECTKEGYVFIGWSDKLGNVYGAAEQYTLVEDTTLTAQWKEKIATFSGHSVTLGGDIGVNYYVVVDDGVTDPVMEIWLTDGVVSELEGELQSDGRYKFRYNVAAAQMTETITCIVKGIKNGEEVRSEEHTYAVVEYAEAALKSDKVNTELKEVAAKMLNYGAYSQMYFNYRTDDLANKNLAEYGYSTELDTNVVDPAAVESIGTDFTGEVLAELTTNTLLLDSRTELRFYMVLKEGVSVEEAYLAYKLKGTEDELEYVAIEPKGERYCATIENVPTAYLNQYYEVFVCRKTADGYEQISQTKSYSAECYANKAIASGMQTLADVTTSLMMYCQAARTYFRL